ncbi:ABC transporter substrate-binding protein [Rhodovibrionaceae bacterium A322]
MHLLKKFSTATALALCLGLGLGTAADQAKAADETLVYAMYDDVKDWDPAVAASLEIVMLANVYEPLVWYNPPGSDEILSPALATEWSSNDDGTVWTFKLREGVTFHDGEKLTAAAAKAALDRTIEMGKGASYIWGQIASIEAPDELTLVITAKSPAPIDIIASSQYAAYIYSPKAAEKGTEWFNQGNAAGTGPYKVRQWDKSQQLVLEANPDYWGGWKDDQFDRVIVKVVGESATQVQMIKSGEADFVTQVPPEVVAGLRDDANVTVDFSPSWTNYQFLLNTSKYPTDNLKFRQALAMAFDYQSVADNVMLGGGQVAKGPIPASMWGHNDDIETPGFDLEAAKALLEESGVPAADRKITMAYVATSNIYENSALLWQANLAKIGVELELRPGPWAKIWDEAKNLETAPNVQSMAWWPTYPTPSDWLIGLFRTEEPALFNLSHYSNSKFDDLVTDAVSLEVTDREQAIAKYKEAQKIVVDDAAAVFYADLAGRLIHRSDIKGVTPNPAYATTFFYKLSR